MKIKDLILLLTMPHLGLEHNPDGTIRSWKFCKPHEGSAVECDSGDSIESLATYLGLSEQDLNTHIGESNGKAGTSRS